MLLAIERRRLKEIESTLKTFTPAKRKHREENRAYFDALKSAIRLYEDIVRRCLSNNTPNGKEFTRLQRLAARFIEEYGGQAEPASVSLKQYDHLRFGPFLGVSDEGGSTDRVVAAALGSPKMQVLGFERRFPLAVGVSLDAERLAAVGEVAVGPEEYLKIRLGCIGRILTSTNVGTRLNLRYYKERPKIEVSSGPLSTISEKVIEEAAAILEPFLNTPNGHPRKLTVFVHFTGRPSLAWRLEMLKSLKVAFDKGDFCKPSLHRLGLLVYVPRGERGARAVRQHIDLVKEAGIRQLAIEGVVHSKAQELISLPDILNFFQPQQVTSLLTYANSRRVELTPWHLIDPDTIARHVWAPLQVARNMGLELGKYGLFPLTLAQSDSIMKMIQDWFCSWTAAPALYVDFPIVDKTRVYIEDDIEIGIKRWLRRVAKHKIPVVLIDTADKSKGRKLLKTSEKDRVGILHLKQILDIDVEAMKLGIRVLWAGGLTLPQAYEMGKLQVFGIYVTTSVSASAPVRGTYRRDPMLPSAKEPTYEGVSRVKLLLESGFLATKLHKMRYHTKADEIEEASKLLISMLSKRRNYQRTVALNRQNELSSLAVEGWRIVLKRGVGSIK